MKKFNVNTKQYTLYIKGTMVVVLWFALPSRSCVRGLGMLGSEDNTDFCTKVKHVTDISMPLSSVDALHKAVEDEATEDVARILSQIKLDVPYANNFPNAQDLYGKTVLYKAIEKGNQAIVNLLVASELIEINNVGNPLGQPKTSLLVALKHGQAAIAKTLIQACPKHKVLDSTTPDKVSGATPLHIAIQYGYTEVAELLVERLAKEYLVVKDDMGRTPLHTAAWYRRKDLFEVLFKKICSLYEGEGQVAQMRSLLLLKDEADHSVFACTYLPKLDIEMFGDMLILVEQYLDASVYENITKEIDTLSGRRLITRTYTNQLKSKANPAWCTEIKQFGQAVATGPQIGVDDWHHAVCSGETNKVKIVLARMDRDRGDAVGSLLNSVDKEGKTALCKAIEKGDEAIVRLLMQHPHIDINQVGNTDMGTTALLVALNNRRNKIARLLVGHGSIDDSKTLDKISGETPLHIAIRHGYIDVTKLLVEQCMTKETLAIEDKAGKTPLHTAAECGQEEAFTIVFSKMYRLCSDDKDFIKALLFKQDKEGFSVFSATYGHVLSAITKKNLGMFKHVLSLTKDFLTQEDWARVSGEVDGTKVFGEEISRLHSIVERQKQLRCPTADHPVGNYYADEMKKEEAWGNHA